MNKPRTYDELKERVFRLEEKLLIRDADALTSKERTEKYIALEDSEKRFRELIEEVSEISIQGYDEDRRVTFWNLASQKLYGYTETEALGNKLEDLIIPQPMREGVIKFHRQWVEKGIKIPAGELVLRHQTGKDVPVFSSHVMLDTRAGKEMFCIDVDLTPIKESEKEKEKLRDQLQQAQKMEAIGTLAGGIAHDFNNILFSIGGVAELLLDDLEADSPTRDTVEEIMSAVQRGSDLVKQILSFSRRSDRKKHPVLLSEIIKEAAKLCRSTIPSATEMDLDIPQQMGYIMANPVQIHQVVMNLITNAVQALGRNPGKISVSLCQVEITPDGSPLFPRPPGPYALLKVSDTGIGIAPDLIEKIFEPYFTTKENGKGTGLGLATVYGIVKEHGGDIKVKTLPGTGSTFKVYLPLAKNSNHGTDTGQPPSRENAPQIGCERILLVDDEPAIAAIEKRLLSRLGYKITDQVSSLEALECFKADPRKFDLVITDMSMPDMTGIGLAKAILYLRQDTPIIICTGFNDPQDEATARELGVKGILTKPVEGPKLARMVRQVLDTKE